MDLKVFYLQTSVALALCVACTGCTASFDIPSFSEDAAARKAILENDKSLKKAFAEIYHIKKELGMLKENEK